MSALYTGAESSRTDVVFDVYLDGSIKNAERDNRRSDSGILFSNIVGGHKVKQCRRLLSSPKSRQSHQVPGPRLAEAIAQNEAS